jgi:hypothetical protein
MKFVQDAATKLIQIYADACFGKIGKADSPAFAPGWREPLSLAFFSFFAGGGYAFRVISCHSVDASNAARIGAIRSTRAVATACFSS